MEAAASAGAAAAAATTAAAAAVAMAEQVHARLSVCCRALACYTRPTDTCALQPPAYPPTYPGGSPTCASSI